MLFKYDHVVKSSYIKDAYYKDRQHDIQPMSTLSNRHFNLTFLSNIQAQLATQVFGDHCAAATYTFVVFQQLLSAAIHTAKSVERIDRLFDSLNKLT